MTTQTPTATHEAVEAFLTLEAEHLDENRFEEWHELFTDDATYLAPLNDGDPQNQALLVNDDALRLEERVYKMTHVPFPSQSPRSRTLHIIGNVRITTQQDNSVSVVSNQLIGEMRKGDFRQVGLGEQRIYLARVEHDLVTDPDPPVGFRIARKCLWLLDRGAPTGNLTFLM